MPGSIRMAQLGHHLKAEKRKEMGFVIEVAYLFKGDWTSNTIQCNRKLQVASRSGDDFFLEKHRYQKQFPFFFKKNQVCLQKQTANSAFGYNQIIIYIATLFTE